MLFLQNGELRLNTVEPCARNESMYVGGQRNGLVEINKKTGEVVMVAESSTDVISLAQLENKYIFIKSGQSCVMSVDYDRKNSPTIWAGDCNFAGIRVGPLNRARFTQLVAIKTDPTDPKMIYIIEMNWVVKRIDRTASEVTLVYKGDYNGENGQLLTSFTINPGVELLLSTALSIYSVPLTGGSATRIAGTNQAEKPCNGCFYSGARFGKLNALLWISPDILVFSDSSFYLMGYLNMRLNCKRLFHLQSWHGASRRLQYSISADAHHMYVSTQSAVVKRQYSGR